MSNDRRMDKEDVIHICNGMLLSHKQEQNCATCRGMDEPRVCHTEWSKSEREKTTLCNIAYMWSQEKMVQMNWFAK